MVYFLVYLFALSSRLFCFYFCTFLRQSDKYGRKHGEYICLDEATNSSSAFIKMLNSTEATVSVPLSAGPCLPR